PGRAREPQPFRAGVWITVPDLDAPRDEPIQLGS
ncbi:phage tail protein, partial [Burkholderia pseudomallei]